ncbi:sugar-binding transcriptional regulator [Acidiphilium sp. AL]|uniref:Sugar-binding transcriptional regulator n=1 Tax=Acidiphilium iwatense TaxID=768198 RepID=A0ABS9DWQ1_9PROT|nr:MULTISPECIES: sugar-binding transcriptional regulator [Acidiphilium]MCF3947124.1 sugar-binding transcriptional regulator [Acidiphilium iwatense]MCU4160607.1 sugar-binding transcriptional regulator [Acidiphilium sp. AL]
MTQPSSKPAHDDAELATRAAWLYYEASLTQAEISTELRVPPAKVQRLIARALRDGLVRILIEGDMAGCITLERELIARHGLDFCRVVPALPGANLFSGLGRAAASYLHGVFEKRQHRIVGIGHGRTLAAAVEHLPRIDCPDLTVVSVLGGVPRRVGANPFDVVHALAEKTGAAAYFLPVPFYANDEGDRAVLLRQRGVSETLRIAEEASLFVLGVGEVREAAYLCESGMILPEEIARAQRDGAIAEAFGTFYDRDGKPVATDLHHRVIAVAPEAMRGRDVLAVAGGAEKAAAIRAMLKTSLPTALITDEMTARLLIAQPKTREAAD